MTGKFDLANVNNTAFYISGPKLLFETTKISTRPNSTQQEWNYIYLYTTKFGTSIKIRFNRVRDNESQLYWILILFECWTFFPGIAPPVSSILLLLYLKKNNTKNIDDFNFIQKKNLQQNKGTMYTVNKIVVFIEIFFRDSRFF